MKRFMFFLVTATLCISFVACASGTSKARQALEQYIEALKKSDFQTLYELNSVTQRKVALIYRGAEADRENNLKNNFEEYKTLFNSIQGNEVSHAVWAEKFLFPSDSSYSIISISVEKDTESKTATFRKRMIARAEVKVSYPNRDTAPTYGEKQIKEATYVGILISGEDVVRGIQSKNIVSDWLFKNINIKEDGITYWPAS
ncbi:MAG: hypothetical protein AABY54_00565 [Deltaproteobacteria bacterium]